MKHWNGRIKFKVCRKGKHRKKNDPMDMVEINDKDMTESVRKAVK